MLRKLKYNGLYNVFAVAKLTLNNQIAKLCRNAFFAILTGLGIMIGKERQPQPFPVSTCVKAVSRPVTNPYF